MRLRLRGIEKSFGATRALAGVDLEARAGEVLALIGARSVRDYVFTQKERRAVAWLGTASPFNIAAEAASLGPFTRDETFELLTQHTTTTGQRSAAA